MTRPASASLLAEEKTLVSTIPTKAAMAQKDNPQLVIRTPPFEVPMFELKMAWSPLLQHNSAHKWIRRLIVEVAKEVEADTTAP